MAEINIEVKGGNRLLGKFRKAADQSPGSFDKTVGRWAKRTSNRLRKKKYPPTRPGQRYKRTRTLARSWHAKRQKSMVWNIENRAQQKGRIYASYVVGDRQAWMHKGRWWIASQEIEKMREELTGMLNKDIERLIF